jgi:transposase
MTVPSPKIEITEHQAEVKLCACGHTTTSIFPKDVMAPVQYGVRAQALAVYLANQQLIPENRVKQVFLDIFSLPLSSATLAKINENFSKTINPTQNETLETLKVAPIKHLDETSLRIAGKTQWLHVISKDQETHYRVSEKRGNLLNGLGGTVVHDH